MRQSSVYTTPPSAVFLPAFHGFNATPDELATLSAVPPVRIAPPLAVK
jgi:hypothetical protein